MKQLFLSIAIVATTLVQAQSEKYNTAMQQSIILMDSAKTTADFAAAAAAFERIGEAEKSQWLPYYFAGLSLTMPAWSDPNIDKDANSEKIKEVCEKAEAIATDNSDKSEIAALRNMAATQQMMVDPTSRWQTYGMEAGAALQTGMKLNPNNPRLYYLQGMSLFGTPVQFGGGHDKAKPLFEKALELFKTEKPKPLYPHWGQQRTEEMIAQCNQ